jgi:hypothetical protein
MKNQPTPKPRKPRAPDIKGKGNGGRLAAQRTKVYRIRLAEWERANSK